MTDAARRLHVSQPSISAQIRKLERAIGHPLFDRRGRTLSLTPEGQIVLDYADEIFRLGQELQDTIHGELPGRPIPLTVGVAHSIPKLIAFHLLEPAFELDDPVHLVIREERTDRLLADLAGQDLDLVIADAPIPPTVSVRAYNHLLGQSRVEIFGAPELARRARRDFPLGMDGMPFLLPSEGFTLRRSLLDWFSRAKIRPVPVAEIEDGALIKDFAEAGVGLFAAPTVVGPEIREKYRVEPVGPAGTVTERFYAITTGRRLSHPAAVAIAEQAQARVFHRMQES